MVSSRNWTRGDQSAPLIGSRVRGESGTHDDECLDSEAVVVKQPDRHAGMLKVKVSYLDSDVREDAPSPTHLLQMTEDDVDGLHARCQLQIPIDGWYRSRQHHGSGRDAGGCKGQVDIPEPSLFGRSS